jgi:DNA-binding HxlR family transcriptional regulator
MWRLSQNPRWASSAAIWSTRSSLARMDNKWTAMVVIALGRGNGLRFRDLRTVVEGISAKVLTETLRDLERDGLVARYEYAEMPPRVEYELTALGRTLHAPLQALGRWAEEHTAEVLAAREAYDSERR